MIKFNHERIWSFEDEHVIDGMIYSKFNKAYYKTSTNN